MFSIALLAATLRCRARDVTYDRDGKLPRVLSREASVFALKRLHLLLHRRSDLQSASNRGESFLDFPDRSRIKNAASLG
jgi:hypothetical protein